MSRFKNTAPLPKGDGGRFYPLFPTPEELNREGGGEEVLKRGGYEKTASPVPRPLSLRALIEADGPPFATRDALVRHLATTWPAHMLDPSFRRSAARDPKLEWRPGTGRYGYRVPDTASARPAPLSKGRADAVQYVGSADAPARAPAPAPVDRDSVGEGGGHES